MLELLKLRFECLVVLDSLSTAERAQGEEVLRRLLPLMFAASAQVRYWFHCLAGVICFHPNTLLCHAARSAEAVRAERRCYAPKVAQVDTLWLPHLVAQHVTLLMPHRKVRWTPSHLVVHLIALSASDGRAPAVRRAELQDARRLH